MTSSQKINFPVIFAVLTLILFASVLHHVQTRDFAMMDSVSVERTIECNERHDQEKNIDDQEAQEVTEVIDEEKGPEIFKPKIVYYNRVGKCGSRSLLSAISKTSEGVRIERSFGLHNSGHPI